MITPIEIRVDLDGDVAAVLATLAVGDRQARHRDMWFAEVPTGRADGSPALLSSGIIIRIRSGEHYDDLTVGLRPCHWRQLAGRWTEPFTDAAVRYRIGRTWSGPQRDLSASVVSRHAAGSLRSVTARGTDMTGTLAPAQRRFLISCTSPGVAVEHLIPLGPIASTKWTRLRVGDAEVDAERWRTADHDHLALSLLVAPRPGEAATELNTRAAVAQSGLEDAVRSRGVTIADGGLQPQHILATFIAQRAVAP